MQQNKKIYPGEKQSVETVRKPNTILLDKDFKSDILNIF